MPLSFRLSAFCLLGGLTIALRAQTPTPAPPAVSTTSSEGANRSSTHEIAATLSGIKFEAPPEPKAKKPPESSVVAGESDTPLIEAEGVEVDPDKPRNTIVRLPKYVIEGQRPAVFTEREINTKKGLQDLAVKRYLSSFGQAINSIPVSYFFGGGTKEQIAMDMYYDDERLKNKRELDEKAELFRRAGDKEAADALRKDASDMSIVPVHFDDPSRLRQGGITP